jgi:nucleoside 2-deoxyribosyltransferase
MKKKIYIAGPLFSDAERSANEAMCFICEKWCDVFLPQRDGHLIPDLIARGLHPEEAYKFVFQKDVNAIEVCDAIVINLDGRAVDEGAAFELGVAHALGKLCVGYRTDVRVLLEWGLNPMVVVPLSKIMSTPAELENWVAAFAQAKGLPHLQPRARS